MKKWTKRITCIAFAAAVFGGVGVSVSDQLQQQQAMQDMDDTSGGVLVEGRDACIQELVKNGKAMGDAIAACDDVIAGAQKTLADETGATAPHMKPGVLAAILYFYITRTNQPYVYVPHADGMKYIFGAPRHAKPTLHLTPQQTQHALHKKNVRAAPTHGSSLPHTRIKTRPSVPPRHR